MENKYLAFVLSAQSRADLMALFPPRYERVVCHHVTLDFNPTSESMVRLTMLMCGNGNTAPFMATTAHYHDDGVECFECVAMSFVSVAEEIYNIYCTTRRADGGTYHVTHSLSKLCKPVHSNEVLKLPVNRKRPFMLRLSGTIELLDK